MIPIVKIEWIDAQVCDVGLISIDEIEFLPCVAEIVGFMVKETDDNYYLAQELWKETNQCKYIHVIPKRSILSCIYMDARASVKREVEVDPTK